jgi:hypothetical protein
MLQERRCAFDPEIVTKLIAAYHDVVHRHRMVDHEDGVILMVACRIIDLALQGEHDPCYRLSRLVGV